MIRQKKLTDLSCDQRLVRAAEDIIESGSCAVSKPIRAGMTTSTVMACEHRGWPLLVLAPTRRILKETVAKASCGAVRVPGNSECPLIEPDLEKNPILRQLPLTLPDCQKCSASGGCEVLAILRAEHPGVMALTYAKLEALILSRGRMAKEILAKISRAEVVMMDEAHVLSLPSAVSVWAFVSLKIPDKYKALGRVYQKWLEFCQSHVGLIMELMERAGQGHAGQHLSRSVFNASFLEWRELKTAWSQLRKLAVVHEMSDDEILALRDIITIMSTSQISVGYISENGGKGGGVYISAGQVRQYRAINEFLTNHVSHAKHLFVSGTLFEPLPGYFSELAGKDIKNVIFPDLRGATEKLTLIPDRWTLGNANFAEKLPVILETIKAIADREKQPIYLLAPNGSKAVWLKEEIAKLGLKGIYVDYYRSDLSLGVERTERVCITVGMAETPANSCDALAHGKDSDDRWLDSRRLRRQGVDAATWQAVNRVRDPDGKVESRIYFIGCRLDRVLQAATWGTNRNLVVKEISERKDCDGMNIRSPIFEVRVDQEIKLPRIYGESKDLKNSERRSVDDFIECIEFYNHGIINSQNHCILPTIIYRENAVKLGIYNFPQNEYELSSTSASLYSLFVNRTDHYAQQFKDSKSGKWTFSKVIGELTEKRIKQHIAGEITTGVYQIALDDTVTWCCDDFDSHNGETDTREKVGKVVGVLRNYGIPFLLEASGSMDSYHLWIFLSRTRTYNAYRFIRQINSEAGVDPECWPKQKKLNKNNRFGNLVKLPVCYHNKSESRSAFIDADTFEPLEGPITPPGQVHLLEIPDLSESSSEGMPKVSIRYETKRKTCSRNVLDYCMQRALDDKVSLQGSEGHHLRLAIAVKAQHIGLSAEETTQLFQSQTDYDDDFSLNKVLETWSYNYSPWSCYTLRDKCGKLINGYCRSCPINNAAREKVRV
ncbi:MAG: hypothetical protein A4E49_00454 [Methanosaeta sp. PtaU1.Bin112]|nr:MAG: hypothetical protein A4E49_00454 [Methanosaeta sp. PtaU1.Bin112]